MSQFNDEEVIKEENKYKKQTVGSIYDEIWIRGEQIVFSEHYFEDGFYAYIPDKFIDIPEGLIQLKYPAQSRPKYIKTSPAGGVDFCFNILPLDKGDEMTKVAGEQMYDFTKRYKYDATFLEQKLEKNERTGNMMYWYDFISRGIDARIYNFMALTTVGEKQMNFSFNCDATDVELWKKVAIEVLESIRGE